MVADATSGLGRAMAQAVAQAGGRVVTSRRRERAQATAAELGAGALGVELDTMKPANRLPVETRPLWADPISDAPLDRLALG